MSNLVELLLGLVPDARQHCLHLLGAVPGLTLTSTRRTPERNLAVGGVKGSYHLSGRAADFAGSPDVLRRAEAFCLRGGPAGGPHGPRECFIEGTGPQSVGGSSTGEHLHVAW